MSLWMGLGATLCFALIIIIIIILVLAFFFSLLLEFLPATVLAIIVFLITGGDLFLAAITFLIVAFIMTLIRWFR